MWGRIDAVRRISNLCPEECLSGDVLYSQLLRMPDVKSSDAAVSNVSATSLIRFITNSFVVWYRNKCSFMGRHDMSFSPG